MTDEFVGYKTIGKAFVEHHTVNHSNKEYVRGNASTNTVEGYFSLLKRGLTGTCQRVTSTAIWMNSISATLHGQ
jgi:hypothetical protein